MAPLPQPAERLECGEGAGALFPTVISDPVCSKSPSLPPPRAAGLVWGSTLAAQRRG